MIGQKGSFLIPEHSSILQRVATGDRTAVDECIEQYGGLIWSIGKNYLRDTSDLEDVTQEVFIELWQSAKRFDPSQGSEVGFVALVARRRMMDRVRRANSRKSAAVQSIEEVDEIGVLEPDAQVWGEELEKVVGCLDKLQSIRKKILVMHLRDGVPHVRISDVLKVPLGTVKSHARRGLLQMQRCVGIPTGAGQVSSLTGGDVG